MTAELLMQIEATVMILSLTAVGLGAFIGENLVDPYTKAEDTVMITTGLCAIVLVISVLALFITWIWS